jgi:G3E family GTPase
MGKLLAEKAADLYRTKGVLAFSNQGDTKFVFQGVHEQINFGPTDKPWIEEEQHRVSKMVFIGKNLDYAYLQQSLKESCTSPDSAIVKMHKRA